MNIIEFLFVMLLSVVLTRVVVVVVSGIDSFVTSISIILVNTTTPFHIVPLFRCIISY